MAHTTAPIHMAEVFGRAIHRISGISDGQAMDLAAIVGSGVGDMVTDVNVNLDSYIAAFSEIYDSVPIELTYLNSLGKLTKQMGVAKAIMERRIVLQDFPGLYNDGDTRGHPSEPSIGSTLQDYMRDAAKLTLQYCDDGGFVGYIKMFCMSVNRNAIKTGTEYGDWVKNEEDRLREIFDYNNLLLEPAEEINKLTLDRLARSEDKELAINLASSLEKGRKNMRLDYAGAIRTLVAHFDTIIYEETVPETAFLWDVGDLSAEMLKKAEYKKSGSAILHGKDFFFNFGFDVPPVSDGRLKKWYETTEEALAAAIKVNEKVEEPGKKMMELLKTRMEALVETQSK